MVPNFPDFREIRLEDREIFLEALSSHPPKISELTFTNLFIWRNHYRFVWSFHKGAIFVLGNDESGDIYALQPIGTTNIRSYKELLEILRDMKKGDFVRFERVGKEALEILSKLGEVRVTPLRDHFDYVYLKSELLELRGNRYKEKRQRIRRAMKVKGLTFSELRSEHISKCINLHERWCRFKRCDEDESLKAEYMASCELFENYHSLGVTGAVITVMDSLIAFSVGEMLNSDTIVVHFEKVDPEYPDFYPLINVKFLEICGEGATFVNREQDLGVPGLRTSKLSYHPHHFEEKYRVLIS